MLPGKSGCRRKFIPSRVVLLSFLDHDDGLLDFEGPGHRVMRPYQRYSHANAAGFMRDFPNRLMSSSS